MCRFFFWGRDIRHGRYYCKQCTTYVRHSSEQSLYISSRYYTHFTDKNNEVIFKKAFQESWDQTLQTKVKGGGGGGGNDHI